MTVKVEFHFDFGSPNAYLSHLVIPGIEARTGVQFEYVPILLGGIFKMTNNQSPAEAFKGIANKMAYMQKETKRFLKKNNITHYHFNPHFPVNTLQLMRGAIVAQQQGFFEKYVDEVFQHMWGKPKKMDDPQVIQSALQESGLDAAALLAGIQQPAVKQKLLSNNEDAVRRGVFGSPSFFVGDELFFGKNCLPEVEAEIEAQKQFNPPLRPSSKRVDARQGNSAQKPRNVFGGR